MRIRASHVFVMSTLGICAVFSSSLVLGQTKTGVLNGASKSSSIALSSDEKYVITANTEDDSISIFKTATLERSAKLEVGDEPISVVILPDNATAFVANQADGTVSKIINIDTSEPSVSSVTPVGSEPTGLALSPTGARLFVAEWAQSRVSVWDTSSMGLIGQINVHNPRALTVTNDGDSDDKDETLVVPEFYGIPLANAEATDSSREGVVRLYRTDNLEPVGPIRFSPTDSGFVPDGTNAGTVKTAPNQFFAAAISGSRVYLTSISASPKAPAKFNGNVYPVVYVGDLKSKLEVVGKNGTTNLAKSVAAALPAGQKRFFLADLADLAFAPNSSNAYVVARGADVLQRVNFETAGVSLGVPGKVQVDLGTAPSGSSLACQNPTGVVVAGKLGKVFVNCWVSRAMAVVNIASQTFERVIPTSSAPATSEELQVNKGRRFFFTGRGRWSKESWSSCGSCHPAGLSDNITWQFGAGPRQTTSLDGSFSHGEGVQQQRIFNWTAIFDEVHDFERNTRDVSGGLGAITTDGCGDLNEERQVTLAGGLDKPVREVMNTTTPMCTKDWDDIEAYMKTIRPPKALSNLEPAAVERGAAVFGSSTSSSQNGNCLACHGGVGWTISKLTFVPSGATNEKLSSAAFVSPFKGAFETLNFNTTQLGNQAPVKDTTTGPAEPKAIGPKQVTCVIRNVGTFGIPGNTSRTDALERKPDNTRAQGRGGFNVPSLYGLALGAPYLHHGQATDLKALFDDPLWVTHLRAGNPNFLKTGDAVGQKIDLIAYLLSIDQNTTETEVPEGFDVCPR
jgi:DNA-binding beta-propeller fold protein YncE/mono/diheme cytochrome c family protein